MGELTDDQAEQHDAAYRRGWKLAEPHMLLGSADASDRLRRGARRNLNKAIEVFHQALAIAPDNWATFWGLGKAYQRLGQAADSLTAFQAAFRLNPTHPDVAREAAAAALAVGDGPNAIQYCLAAIEAAPDDASLIANLALAYLVYGDVDRAASSAREAVRRNPDDESSRRNLGLIRDVQAGLRDAPKKM